MSLRSLPVLAGLLSTLIAAGPAAAQSPLRVLRHTPVDSAPPSAVIAITFDRPVAGQLGASVDPRRVLRIDPAIEGEVAWRDPVTIEFRPALPLTPGLRLTATVDTTFASPGGARLAEPYRVSLRVVGPTPIATLPSGEAVGPRPVFRALYSAPVDVRSLRALARVELDAPCAVRSVPLIPARQVPVARTDAWYWFGDWPRDTVADALRRIVEFEPAGPLPAGCRGFWHVPSLDPERPGSTWRYGVATWPEPRISVTCSLPPCRQDGLRLDFGAPVRARDVMKYVRITPAIGGSPRDSMAVGPTHVWNARLTARTTYTVSVDTALRDVFGRPLTISSAATYVPDRLPTIYHDAGAITVARTSPSITVRTVNVDSIRVSAFPIPDSLRGVILANSRYTSAAAASQLRPALGDTIVFTVPVRGVFNHEALTEIPLANVVGRTAYTAISLDVARASVPPDSAASPRSAGSVDHVGFGVQYVQVSDLIAHAKVGRLDGAVFVTTRAGAPVPGASIDLIDGFGNRLASGRTGRDGLGSLVAAHAPPPSRPATARDPFRAMARFLEISTASDRLTLPVAGAIDGDDQRGLEPWQLDARPDYPSSVRAVLSTDRGIYRPGERLYARIVARAGWRGALTPAAGDSLRWQIIGDSEDAVWAGTATLSPAGTAADSLTLPSSLALTTYNLSASVRHDGVWKNAGDHYFRVAEYRAPEFELAVQADSAPRVAGDTIAFRIHGEYLLGAPMSSAVIRWSGSLYENWGTWLPKLEGYAVGVDRWWWRDRSPIEQRSPLTGVDSLDARGERTIRIPSGDASTFSRPATLQFTASATDAGNQSVASSRSVTIHPVSTYIAVRRGDGNRQWQVGRRERFEMSTVRPDGSTRPGVRVALAIRRMRWIPLDARDPVTGMMGDWHVDTIETRRFVTDTSPVVVDFTPRSTDHFDLIFTARDEQERVTSTSLHGVVEGTFAPYGPRPVNRLRLAITRASTRPAVVGDTVTVAFDSPFASAHAWITTEREGIISQRRMTAARGRNNVRVPIVAGHVPNVWVGVTLIRRDRVPSRMDSLQNEIRAGYLEIPVDASARRVYVTIDPGVTYAPGDTAVVRVTVRERDSVSGPGVPAEVAMWAVDDGILALTGYQPPDLFRAFYSAGGLGNALRSSLTVLPANNLSFMQLRGGAGVSPRGGPEGVQLAEVVLTSAADQATVSYGVVGQARSESPALRQSFRSTAFFLGAIHTGRDGSATIRAKLPDNVTTYRIMAVATTADDRYGSGETRMLTTRDLVLRPAFPRFVRPGDEMHAGGLVNVRSGASDRVRVDATVTGAAVRGDTMYAGNVDGGRPMAARFDLRVPADATSVLRIVLRAVGSLGSDAVATTMPLGPVGTPRAHTVTGVVRDSTTMRIDLPADIDPARSTITLGFGGSPIAAIRSHQASLRAYPYYATECLVSAARALIALQHAEAVLDDHSPEMDSLTVRSDLQRAADAVIRREAGGYVREWDSDSPYQHLLGLWSTAYAGEFLVDARARGIRVSSGPLERIIETLRERAEGPGGMLDTVSGSPHERRTRWQAWLGTRVVVAKFLRHAGRPDTTAERDLLARAGEMRWEDRVWLADLLVDAGREPEARAMLDEAWRVIRPIGRRLEMPDSLRGFAGFPSHVRPAARLMIVTMRLDPGRPLVGALAETLMQQGRAEQDWAWNTQDYATAAIALADFTAASRGSAPRRVVMLAGGREVLAGTTSATTSGSALLTGLIEPRTSDSSRVSVSIRAAGASGAPVFFAITVTEVPKSRPVTPDVTGIVVERWYESFTDGKPIVEATEGDLVRVRLRVTVPADRQFVAVEDLLPAGLEPVDLTLRTEGIGPFATTAFAQAQERMSDSGNLGQALFYGGWDGGWWTPWEHKEIHDDRVTWTTRQLWAGSYTASYVARATTPGTWVRPPAHAEEMYDRAIQGRSDGGVFLVRRNR